MKTETFFLIVLLLLMKDEKTSRSLLDAISLLENDKQLLSLFNLFSSPSAPKEGGEREEKREEEKKTQPPLEGIANEEILQKIAAYLSHER